MKQKQSAVSVKKIEQTIYIIRAQRVMLDADLARIYGVETKALNRAVKRNKKRFPSDFVFRLTNKEVENLRCQIGTSTMRSQIGTASKRNVRYLPYAFTEHGAIMAANVLNSPRAAQMSVFVVRAFVRMRAMLTDNRELAAALKALEKELKERLDTHEAAIVDILRRLMDIIDPPPLPEPPKKEIGFHVKEEGGAYRVHRKQV
jgi:phage regulator Rha-like protein